jgi:ubiquinone/menaquinone biosynthesis C-methylase UbiE
MWTVKYLSRSRQWMYEPDDLPLIRRFFDVRQGKHVLDVGCGLGFLARILAQRVGDRGRVVGLDRKEKLLSKGRSISRRTRDGIRFRKGDALDMPFRDNTFDVAVCQTLFINTTNPERLIAEMTRVVRPGGVIGCLEPVRQIDGLNSFSPPPWRKDDTTTGMRIWHAAQRIGTKKTGMDDTIAPSLPDLFFRTGLKEIRTRGFALTRCDLERDKSELRESLRENARYRPSKTYVKRAIEGGISHRTIERLNKRIKKISKELLRNDRFTERPTGLFCCIILAVRGTVPEQPEKNR